MTKKLDLELILALAWLLLGRLIFEIYKSSVLAKSSVLELD
jgi:hypothetical protein